MKKTILSLGAAGLVSVAGILGGVRPAHAYTTYTCTHKSDGKVTKVVVYNDQAEDNLEAHGFTCTGD